MTKLERLKGSLDWVAHGKLIFDLVVATAGAKLTKALLASFTKLPEIWRSPIEWFIGALILGTLPYLGRNWGGKLLPPTAEAPVVEPNPCVGLFSPLQLETFQLAKDMRSFLKNFEPIPRADYGRTESQKMKSLGERVDWRRRLESTYHLNFDDRLKAVELKLGANKIHMNHLAINASNKRGIEEEIVRYAAVLVAMAHGLDGVVLGP